MDNCNLFSSCLNNDKCWRCNDQKLHKPKFKQKVSNNKHSTKDKNSDDSWKLLEQDIVNDLNRKITIQDARRARGSGNQWFEKSDVVHNILQIECKERTGTLLASGEKSFSIKKEWLTKAENEAIADRKTMALPFRFKGDDDTYIIMKSSDIIELVNTMNAYIEDNDLKRAELEVLKKRIDHSK